MTLKLLDIYKSLKTSSDKAFLKKLNALKKPEKFVLLYDLGHRLHKQKTCFKSWDIMGNAQCNLMFCSSSSAYFDHSWSSQETKIQI